MWNMQQVSFAPSKTFLGLPIATKFQVIIAMDLKLYDSKLILHLIDHATRLSSAKRFSYKQPEIVAEAILSICVSVYGLA